MSDLTYDDLERSHGGHVVCQQPVSWKRYTLDKNLQWGAYRKPYRYYTVMMSDLTYDDLERSYRGHVVFNRLYHGNRAH